MLAGTAYCDYQSGISRLRSLPKRKVEFIEPIEWALVSKLPEGPGWTYEVKLDGYRAVGVKSSRDTVLYSRSAKNFNKRFPQIAEALRDLPGDTVIDGEVVALHESGRPDFHRLQHFQAEASRIRYFVFDLLISNGRDSTKLPLIERRKVLADIKHPSWIRISEQFDISADDMPSGSALFCVGLSRRRVIKFNSAGLYRRSLLSVRTAELDCCHG